jgi:hypothetical protein
LARAHSTCDAVEQVNYRIQYLYLKKKFIMCPKRCDRMSHLKSVVYRLCTFLPPFLHAVCAGHGYDAEYFSSRFIDFVFPILTIPQATCHRVLNVKLQTKVRDDVLGGELDSASGYIPPLLDTDVDRISDGGVRLTCEHKTK